MDDHEGWMRYDGVMIWGVGLLKDGQDTEMHCFSSCSGMLSSSKYWPRTSENRMLAGEQQTSTFYSADIYVLNQSWEVHSREAAIDRARSLPAAWACGLAIRELAMRLAPAYGKKVITARLSFQVATHGLWK